MHLLNCSCDTFSFGRHPGSRGQDRNRLAGTAIPWVKEREKKK
jgi:hypothetical protein